MSARFTAPTGRVPSATRKAWHVPVYRVLDVALTRNTPGGETDGTINPTTPPPLSS
ncbi:MAG: hypothetical protein VYB54_05140 [Pseudomonadota bacterium]|nr:hypothetical protein [Pseudomonadota bacterium]